MRLQFSAFALLLLMASFTGSAETLVFIQGYLGGAQNWRNSGITQVLQESGWRDGGHLRLLRLGVSHRGADGEGIRRFYTLELPTEAPLITQSRILAQYLAYIRRYHPESSLILAGHSAGGVLARLYMVQHPNSKITALITIASPHRGTESAELGLMAAQSPLAWLGSAIGIDTLDRSKGLYYDLSREHPGNLLGWLNYQRHPPALYASIVRRKDDETYGLGNLIVPAWSQDMNQVYALRGRAKTITVNGSHRLRSEDGKLILRILDSLGHA